MPPWPSRLPFGSSSAKKATDRREPGQRNPPPPVIDRNDDATSLPLHGVPLVSRTLIRQSQSPNASLHARSRSHPFPTPVRHQGSPQIYVEDNSDEDDEALHQTSYTPDREALKSPASVDRDGNSRRFSPAHGNAEFISGKCATCDSAVRWPKHMGVFRCSRCLMINTVQNSGFSSLAKGGSHITSSAKASQNQNGIKMSKWADNMPIAKVTTERTAALIDQCIASFLASKEFRLRLEHLKSASPMPMTMYVDGAEKSIAAARGPGSSVSLCGEHKAANRQPDANAQSSSLARQDDVFRPLEDYLSSCLERVSSLNLSFVDLKSPKHRPSVRDAEASQNRFDAGSTRQTRSDSDVVAELDAKTLLVADFAENGSWWSGLSPRDALPKTSVGTPQKPNEQRLKQDIIVDPDLEWAEVDRWYQMLLALPRTAQQRAQSTIQTYLTSSGIETNNPERAHLIRELSEALETSSYHLQSSFMKMVESLLKHPGQRLQSPGDYRFLLILMDNPSLSQIDSRSEKNCLVKAPASSSGALADIQLSSSPKTRAKGGLHQSPKTSKYIRTIRHANIIKRILGLMANINDESKQVLVTWLSAVSKERLSRLLHIVNAFISHRLVRGGRKQRSNSVDPTAGGLIPDISGPVGSASAQLHATIGSSESLAARETQIKEPSYSDDWQVKSATKVMLLLYSASINHVKRGNDHKGMVGQKGKSHQQSLKLTPRKFPTLPSSMFYNSALDYIDLIADFEVWESRKNKFCFCQYPMTLSIWAKIRIMEFDARRQMEIKAREAFFTSILNRSAISQYLVLRIRRDCLVEDSLRSVSEVVGSGQEEIKKGLRIEFVGEEGLDSGGLRKEWFLLLVREVFDPEHGLFIYDEDSRHCYFNPNTFETSDQYFLVGVLFGLAIYNSTILDVALPPFAYRKLLASAPPFVGNTTYSVKPSISYSVEDLAEYRPSLAQGLRRLLDYEGDVQTAFNLDFIATVESYGQIKEVPLCSNGANRPVTNTNRKEFVDLYVRYLLDMTVSRQFEPFKRGFFTVCGGNAISLFRPEEIELLVRGSEEVLAVAALKAVATYDGWTPGELAADNSVVSWFWHVFANAPPKRQRKLLSFITGSDRIPAMGAASLVIKIGNLGNDVARYPIARTCFNMIGLYKYETQDLLDQRLWTAVEESEGFGIR